MARKRRSRGRSKGSKGRQETVVCCKCKRLIPRDKAKKVTRWISYVDPYTRRLLEQSGAIIPKRKVVEYYCISCAIHYGLVKIRSKEERKIKEKLV